MCLLGNVFVLSTFLALVTASIDEVVLNPKDQPALPSSSSVAAADDDDEFQILTRFRVAVQSILVSEPVFVVSVLALTAWIAVGTEFAHTQWDWGYAQVSRDPHHAPRHPVTNEYRTYDSSRENESESS